jgi:Tfp pilus assembly protein PilX
MRRRRHVHGERGSVLVIAIVLMTVMLAVALASFSFVDTGQLRAREQRERETSLNLAEAVLATQGFALAHTWPGNAAGGAAIPATCTSAAGPVQSLCPDPNTLAAGNSSSPASANFTNVDASSAVSWTTRIRDNGEPIHDGFLYALVDAAQSGTNAKTGAAYTCPSPCRWDANGDLKLWVQARAVVHGRPRNLVALLKREEFGEAIARNGVTAGSFETTNNGNKTIIDASGSQVVVRCTSTAGACTDYNAAKSQVLPATIVRDTATPPAMSAAQIARFKAGAQSASPPTYYTSCPASLTGAVVFVDLPFTSNCTVSNGATYNSAAAPGIVIMPRGTLSMKASFYGILYLGNAQGSSGPVLTLQANAQVLGGVAIDGAGRLVAGQASGQQSTITFVASAFDSLVTHGTTGLVQNTWRELPPG